MTFYCEHNVINLCKNKTHTFISCREISETVDMGLFLTVNLGYSPPWGHLDSTIMSSLNRRGLSFLQELIVKIHLQNNQETWILSETATGYIHENTNSLFWLRILGYSALVMSSMPCTILHGPCMVILQKQQEYQTKSTELYQVIWASSSLGCLITAVCFSLRVFAWQMRESRSLFTVKRPGLF